MTYTKISLYLANGIPEALSNLWYGSDSAVVEIRDAVEDGLQTDLSATGGQSVP